MRNGGELRLSLDPDLNLQSPGKLRVYLHEVNENEIRVDLDPGNNAEPADIVWLPWRQGEMPMVQPYSISSSPPETIFLTYELTGCKIFGIQGGPVWHIDAEVSVDEFWPIIQQEEWVQENWPAGETQNLAYLHRAGQPPELWDLSAHLAGAAPTTYGSGGNLGNAFVGGIVNDEGQLDFYFQASPWKTLPYAEQVMKS